MHEFLCVQVLGASLKTNEEGRKHADEVNKNVKLLIERSHRSEERLTLVKTIAVNGCILFMVELSPPPGPTTREKAQKHNFTKVLLLCF